MTAVRTTLLLFLMIGFASALSLPSLQGTNSAQAVCTAVSLRKELAGTILRRVIETLSRAEFQTKFPLTLAYISDPTNVNALMQGGQSCITFFANLQQKLQADLRTNGLSGQTLISQLTQIINNPTQFLTSLG